MRIRKNAKLSSLSFSSSHASTPLETLQTHVCQLNQSPWDVITFSPCSDYNNNCYYPSLNHQFESEDISFTGNGSFDDSINGAVESAGSIVFKVDDMVIDDNEIQEQQQEKVLDNINDKYDEFVFKEEDNYEQLYCVKSDGNGWQCRNEAKTGHNLCDHHLSLLKSCGNGNTTAVKKLAVAVAASNRRGRGRAAKRGSSSSASNKNPNPYEFYYYSGFGPSWGKRRGEKACAATVTQTDDNNNKTPDSSSSQNSQIEAAEEFDFVDDDFDDDEDDDEIGNADNGKKRMRKPVKARSLKSLM